MAVYYKLNVNDKNEKEMLDQLVFCVA